jgi:hypothetical protein
LVLTAGLIASLGMSRTAAETGEMPGFSPAVASTEPSEARVYSMEKKQF